MADGDKEPLTIEDLLNVTSNHAGNPHWRGYFGVRVQVRPGASVPLIGECSIVTDSPYGPHLLLEVDATEVGNVVVAEFRDGLRVMSETRDARFEEDAENRRLVIEASGITNQRELVRVLRSIGHNSKTTDRADDNFWAAAEILRNPDDPEHAKLTEAFAAYKRGERM